MCFSIMPPGGHIQSLIMWKFGTDITARIELNLKEPQETLDTLCGLARDRNAWRDIVRRAMLHQ